TEWVTFTKSKEKQKAPDWCLCTNILLLKFTALSHVRVMHVFLHRWHFHLVLHHLNLVRHHTCGIQLLCLFQQTLSFLTSAPGYCRCCQVQCSHGAVLFHIKTVFQCFFHIGFHFGRAVLSQCQSCKIMEVSILSP